MIVYQRVCDFCTTVMPPETQIRSVSGGVVSVPRMSLTGPMEVPVPQPADLHYAELCSDGCAERWWAACILKLPEPEQAS